MAEERSRVEAESKAAMSERIKPLPSLEGMEDEQLKQLARELHAAIDKVSGEQTAHQNIVG